MINMRQALQQTAQNDLVSSEPDSGWQNFCLAADFIGFDGHFPGYPVLPAMLQVLLGIIVTEKLYCQKLCSQKLTLQKLDKAKFMSQIQPGQTLNVACKITRPAAEEPQQTIKSRVTITVAEKKAASMTLYLDQNI